MGGSQRLCLSLSELGSILVPQSRSSQGRGCQQNNGTYRGRDGLSETDLMGCVEEQEHEMTKMVRTYWFEERGCNVAETAVCLLSINFLLFR